MTRNFAQTADFFAQQRERERERESERERERGRARERERESEPHTCASLLSTIRSVKRGATRSHNEMHETKIHNIRINRTIGHNNDKC